MDFVLLDDDEFVDFNFSQSHDPALQPGHGPDHRQLYRMVIEARQGDRTGFAEFAEVMYRTLRPEAFESFQRTHGARPISYADWFFSKLYLFFQVLLHDSLQVMLDGGYRFPLTDAPWKEGHGRLLSSGAEVHPDDLECTFEPARHSSYPWLELAARCSRANAADRLRAVLQFVRAYRDARPTVKTLDVEQGRRPRGDQEILERDQLIAEQLLQDTPRKRICALLDQDRFSVTHNMEANGILTWTLAWKDPQFRKDVQSIFSKAQRRFTSPD